MSRTYRRRAQRHDYDRVLRDYDWVNGVLTQLRIDAWSKKGRHALARFHSDAYAFDTGTAPTDLVVKSDIPRPRSIVRQSAVRVSTAGRCPPRSAD